MVEVSLDKEQVGRYTNFYDEDGEIVVSVDEQSGEVVTYDEYVDEPRSIYRPDSGWSE